MVRSRRRPRRSQPVVDELLAHPYFASRRRPKSTGRELFDRAYVERLVARCREVDPRATNDDVIATATALTASQHRRRVSPIHAGAGRPKC